MTLFIVAIITIVVALIIGIWAQIKVGSTYAKWSKVGSRSGMTGMEAAQYVMREAGIADVKITRYPATLPTITTPRQKNSASARRITTDAASPPLAWRRTRRATPCSTKSATRCSISA